MGYKNNRKEQVIERPKTYRCSICLEEHEINKTCPIILKKLNKMEKQKGKVFYWGNIFLECLEQDKNFRDLLHEVSYINEMLTDRDFEASNINMELVLNYCASELSCSPKKFMLPPEKTVEKFMNLISGDLIFNEPFKDDSGQIAAISFGVDDFFQLPDSKYGFWSPPNLVAVKEKLFDNSWCYRLYFDSDILINGKDGHKHKYFVCDGNVRSSWIFLAEDHTGPLAKEIESLIDSLWLDIYSISSDDVRFDLWINRLKEETLNNRLCWENPYGYKTKFEGYSIVLSLNSKRYTYENFERKESVLRKFGVRFDRDNGIAFILKEDDEEEKIEKLLSLEVAIKESMNRMETLVQTSTLKEKKIEFTDVMVVSSSMHCKNKDHQIVPYCGIVNILTEDNKEIEHQIYVGYCMECKTYTVFDLDYKKMLEKGKPLCVVYQYNDFLKGKVHSEFRYKSQSVLAIKGYNVQAGNDLSDEERQAILKECLESKIIETHDLLDFLNWLVKTREPLAKYENAIVKWKKDIHFVEEYRKDERDTVFVKSITIK